MRPRIRRFAVEAGLWLACWTAAAAAGGLVAGVDWLVVHATGLAR